MDMYSIKNIAIPGSNKMKKKITRINTENTEVVCFNKRSVFFLQGDDCKRYVWCCSNKTKYVSMTNNECQNSFMKWEGRVT